ncbi:hypothetical protein DJ94_5020 [Bacillus pseudomycoides]|nr:hypothetical protein DJ94_5020 [Bacillus pseudomycoides]
MEIKVRLILKITLISAVPLNASKGTYVLV